jgi:hypothetical protein
MYKEFFIMRMSTTLALSAALATAACSSGPSPEQIGAANEALKACASEAGQKQKLEITNATLNIPEKDAAQTEPSYVVGAKVPDYWEKRKGKNDKQLDTKITTSLTFTSVAGQVSVTSSSSMNSMTDQKGARVEGGSFSTGFGQSTPVAQDAVINGVKIADIVAALPDCGKQGYSKLAL